jgi:hypothetical protein
MYSPSLLCPTRYAYPTHTILPPNVMLLSDDKGCASPYTPPSRQCHTCLCGVFKEETDASNVTNE